VPPPLEGRREGERKGQSAHLETTQTQRGYCWGRGEWGGVRKEGGGRLFLRRMMTKGGDCIGKTGFGSGRQRPEEEWRRTSRAVVLTNAASR